MKFVLAVSIGLLIPTTLFAWRTAQEPTRKIAYKTIGDVILRLHYFEPRVATSESRSAIVFFFGGGWIGGSPSQFYPQAALLAEKGIAAFCAEYRVKSRHGTSPFECVRDGKSAIRWVRQHAPEFHIAPDRIAAAGGSAGGHVAACTALLTGMDDEPTTVSSSPNALILFNPVIDTSELGFGYNRLNQRYREVSPLEHVSRSLPPTIIFQGLADTTTPPAGHREFQRRMQKFGNECHLHLFPNQTHGFFNPGRGGGVSYQKTVTLMEDFLRKHDYISAGKN